MNRCAWKRVQIATEKNGNISVATSEVGADVPCNIVNLTELDIVILGIAVEQRVGDTDFPTTCIVLEFGNNSKVVCQKALLKFCFWFLPPIFLFRQAISCQVIHFHYPCFTHWYPQPSPGPDLTRQAVGGGASEIGRRQHLRDDAVVDFLQTNDIHLLG